MYACRVVAGFSRGWEGTDGVYRALSGLQEDMQAISQQSASLFHACYGMARKKNRAQNAKTRGVPGQSMIR
jgi:hypothetical protein